MSMTPMYFAGNELSAFDMIHKPLQMPSPLIGLFYLRSY